MALKLFSARTDDGKLLRDFESEFLLLTQLKHPGVVEALDFGYSEHAPESGDLLPYFTMEFVAGKSLSEACARLCDPGGSPLGFERLSLLAWRICDILEFLHLRGIVHCDLKPDNIKVIGRALAPKILDFGLFEAMGSRREENTKGTLPYMAPEMFKHEPLDGRTDLYSLGVILYQLVTSRLPFSSDDPVKIVSAHIQESPGPPSEFNPNLPAHLEELILRLLEKSPASRPGNATQVKEMLATGLGSSSEKTDKIVSWPQNTRLAHINSGPMVGRKRDLDRIVRDMTSATGQAGSCLFVCGELGVGKTFLLKQLQLRSQLENIVYLDASCLDGQTLAYQPLMEILRKLEPYVESRCDQGMLSDLRKIFRRSESNVSSSAETQASLHRRIARLLLSVSESFPFVAVVENLQWADPPTLQFLEHFQTEINKGKVFLCCSLRQEKLTGNAVVESAVRRCLDNKNTKRLELGRFDLSTTRDLICSKLAENQFPPDFFTHVHQRTSGNPFFVVEVLKYLLEKDLIILRHGSWVVDLGGLRSAKLPATIEAVLLKNLGMYDKRTVDLLQTLAVVGNRFSLRLLRGLALAEPDELSELLSLLTRNQVLIRKDQTGEDDVLFEFANQSLQNLLYQRQKEKRRISWHRKTAEFLEKMSPSRDEEEVFEIAHHYLQGRRPHKAYEYALLCAKKMERRFSTDDVLTYLEDAATAASTFSDSQEAMRKEAEARKKKADFCLRVGELSQAEKEYLSVLRMMKDSTDGKILVAAYNGLGEVCRLKHDYKGGIAYLQKAMEIHGELNDPLERAHTLSFMGLTYWIDSQYQEALSCFREALEIDRSLGDRFYEANTLNNMGLVYWSRRQYRQALKHFTDALSVYKELDNKEWLARTQNNIGATLFELGDYGRCIEHFMESYRLNRKTGNEKEMAFNLENLGEAYRKVGDYSRALEYGRNGLRLATDIEFTDRVGRILKGLGATHLELGEYAKAGDYLGKAKKVADGIEDKELQVLVLIESARLATSLNDRGTSARLLDEATSLVRAIDDDKSLITLLQLRSSLERRQGNLKQALKLLNQAFAVSEKLNVREETFTLSLDCAELYLEQGNLDKSRESLHQARESGLELYVSYQPAFHLISGKLEQAQGNPKPARGAFETALRLGEKLGKPEVLWRIHHRLGRLLLLSRDIEAAYGELKRAAAILKKLCHGVGGEEPKRSYMGDPEKKDLLSDLKAVAKELVGNAELV